LAVVWQKGWGTDQHWLTTYDAPHRLTQSHRLATLVLPPFSLRAGLSDRSVATFDCGPGSEPISAPVIFPRIVIYEDVDKSGDFNPDLPLAPGIDRVWGVSYSTINQSLIAAFEDLDDVLSSSSLAAAECLRSFTSDTYSAFFQGIEASATQVSAAKGTSPSAFVGVSASDYARVLMNCPPGAANPMSVSSTNSRYETPRRWVDATVSNDLCSHGDCTPGGSNSLVLPELTSYVDRGYKRSAECYVFGSLDVLLLKEFSLVCEQCDCHWNVLGSSWVVESTRPPARWPCGTSVPFCSTPAASLWVEPSSCSTGSSRPQ
ncbi:MAG TPA: hypothetical protein VIV60_25365, partial [Polyangiaceae bacterium]